MLFKEFKAMLNKAAEDNKLMTPKHDPKNLGTLFSSYRTVISHELSANLLRFINSDNYSITEYVNLSYPKSPLYLVIKPEPNKGFEIPSSGVTAYSPFATSALDRLIVVSGQLNGLHMFGESSSVIELKVSNGELVQKGKT